MTRSELKTFIQTGIISLSPAMSFGSGRITEFNSERMNEYPAAWLETVTVDSEIKNSINFDGWPIRLHIAKKDLIDSSPAEYEAIIDQCDAIAQQLIYKFNNIISGFRTSTISNISREPFIKKNADCITGVILIFNLNAPDLTDIC